MKLKNLKFENFRNYPNHSYEFPEGKELIVMVGKNGIGKTNFLEAIHVLSLGKSFRSLAHEDLINWEMDYLRLNAEAEIDDENCQLEVFYSSKPTRRKNFKKNGVNLKNSEYLGNLLTVLFHPEDLNMLYLSPSLRRRYVDIVLCQTDKSYLLALSKYKKTLKQRNALLAQIREAHFNPVSSGSTKNALQEDLAAWDEEIIEYGSPLILKRLLFINFLNENIGKIYRNISGEKERVEIEYVSKVIKNSDIPHLKINDTKLSDSASTTTNSNQLTKNHFNPLSTISQLYADTLSSRKRQDIFRAETTAGPHRDDLFFFINGKNICSSASRGEFRTLLLALKLAEIEFIKQKTGKNPILLLDDVFSELDRKRQTHLLKAIKGCQTIITTTEISKDLTDLNCKIHNLS